MTRPLDFLPHPFGGVHTSTPAPPSAHFPGQWFQSESGLHQNWMRDYDPTTGRYLQADPLGLIDGASVYGYVRQTPMMLTDPTGECPWCAVAAAAAIGAGISLLLELWEHDGRWECVNWANVGIGGALGAFSGGWGAAWWKGLTGARGLTSLPWWKASRAYKAAMGVSSSNISHHAIIAALKNHPAGWRNAWWNLKPLSPSIHNALHGQFGAARMGAFNRWRHGTPYWLLGAEGSMYSGAIAEIIDSEKSCVCES